MIWKILIALYAVVVLLIVFFSVMERIIVRNKFKAKHPHVKEMRLDSSADLIFAWVRLIVVALIPILNIAVLFTHLSQSDMIIEQAIKTVESKIIAEN